MQVRLLPEDEQQRELASAYKVLSCGLQADVAKQLRSAAGLRQISSFRVRLLRVRAHGLPAGRRV